MSEKMNASAFIDATQALGLAVDRIALHPLYAKLAMPGMENPRALNPEERGKLLEQVRRMTPGRRMFYLACEPATGLYTHGMCDIAGGYTGTKLEDYALLAPTDSIDTAIDQVIERTRFEEEPERKPEAGSFAWSA